MKVEGGASVTTEFHFVGDHALMVNDAGEVAALYNVPAATTYIDKHERMVEERFIAAWLNGWRTGAKVRQLLADPTQEPFVRSLLWPALEVRDEAGTLLIRTKAMHFEIEPMKEIDPATASAYAAIYKLEAYRNAFETRNATGAFIASAVADVLRDRRVIPQTMRVTTFTPKGSATIHVVARRERMREQDIARLRAVAQQLDRATPATQPQEE